ncbi:CDP-glucose 4,6-dehydratase [Arcobacter cloacae]|uniref:CDP-glucose 4,6-dehydratase n=1 Tax=Arcobacter cloacae TaxID=1054034 RepID=A0A4Q0ZLA1_9BACT|nr:CDP-glucose 4,6-dehydratase [Arcobacter cloacae]
MQNLFSGIYKNKTVLITGHTGFKGSWLCFWLKQMGANVIGYSLDAPTTPNHFELLNLDIISIKGDIKNFEHLNTIFQTYKPDIVFHLAAQSLVKYSYDNPIETYETNVIGTLKVFEACKNANTKCIVNITSDKAYENKEWIWGYKETDSLGGYDPYSSSKSCSDILTNSYRNSFFNPKDYKKRHNTLIASCRAGNVIGGGDWAKDRLMSDIMLSISQNKKVEIRNPNATRPWQHVLEPLSGYLYIGQKLFEEKVEFSEAWNFGPNNESNITVKDVLKNVKKYWDKLDYEINLNSEFHEANLLKIDSTKANTILKWNNVWDKSKSIEKTVNWYKNFYENNKVLTSEDLMNYILDAKEKGVSWIKN